MFAVLECTTVEGYTRVEIGPVWVDKQVGEFLTKPDDNVDESYEWKFFADRVQLINAGY